MRPEASGQKVSIVARRYLHSVPRCSRILHPLTVTTWESRQVRLEFFGLHRDSLCQQQTATVSECFKNDSASFLSAHRR